MFNPFDWLKRRRGPFFEQEVKTELRYLRSAFSEDPMAAALERLQRRSKGSSEYRVIQAAITKLKANAARRV